MQAVSILGCGWLGLPLAKSLIEKGFCVNGSTTSEAKIAVLKNARINPFLISLHADKIEGEILSFLQNSEILIVDIPPKLRGLEAESFVEKIKTLIPFIENAAVKKVLFISSISVYADDNSTITETSKPNADSESGTQLAQAEQLLQGNPKFKTTILRFGGLIGDDRHPIKFLAGRKNIENPDAPINLIHQNDCIGIIEKIIELEKWNEIFNAAAPFHPTRKDYYTQKAIALNLPLPEFEQQQSSNGKIISSTKIETLLGFHFTSI
jgi:nucleoside-diphosphate-sugar epimerase